MSAVDWPEGDATQSILEHIRHSELRRMTRQIFTDAQNLIDDHGYRLVVMAARRLPCLYQALVAGGMPQLTGATVITDRALGHLQPGEWSRVLVLDDSVILGSTLARLYDDIKAMPGVKDVATRAICLDLQEYAAYLTKHARVTALAKVSSEEVAEFSQDLVRLLFATSTPFFSDFPVSQRFDLPRDQWLRSLEDSRWRVADATAPLLQSSNRSALVLLPTAATTADILGGLPDALVKLIDFLKVRVYVEHTKLDERVRIRVVPICLFKPCSEDDIFSAAESLSKTIATSSSNKVLLQSSETTLRAMQYLTSLYVLHRVGRNLLGSKVYDANQDQLVDPVAESLSFGPCLNDVRDADRHIATLAARRHTPAPPLTRANNSPRPYPLLQEPKLQKLVWEQQEWLATIGLPPEPKRGEITKIGLGFSHAVISLFGYISENFERHQRKKIAALPSMAAYRKKFPRNSDARLLDMGFTVEELRGLLCLTHANREWAESSMTLALDIGNDLGVTVPVTSCDRVRKVWYRAFRLGETASLASVPFGEMRWGNQSQDEVTKSLKGGYPLKSFSTGIPSHPASWGEQVQGRKARTDELRKLVTRALPGRTRERFFGTVDYVQEGVSFIATLRSSEGAFAGQAEFDWAVLADDSREITEGCEVSWTRFERMEEGNRLRSSRVRILPEWEVSDAVVTATAKELAELIGVE